MSGIAPRIDTIESQVAVAGVTYIGNASGESGTTGYTVYSERKAFTVTIATPGVFTVAAHGYSDGDAVSLSTTGALPTGLAVNTVYYVVNKATNTFNLSTTLGGSAIATSGTQSGVHTIGPVVAHVGTGGVAAGTTFTVSNINPLRGLQSFVFSKDAANRMGEGVSYNFTIDRADLAKVLTVGFEYQVNSGTLNDGDVRVYLIQDPNGVPSIIQPAGLTVLGATAGVKMKHVATFQSDFTAREYRLCIHVASTSVSAWSLGVDSISVGPQQRLYGAPITDWQSYTTTVSNLGAGSSTNAARYRRVGDEIEFWVQITKDATPGSGALPVSFTLPSGVTADTSKIPSSSEGLGIANLDTATFNLQGPVFTLTTTTIAARKTGTAGNITGADLSANSVLVVRGSVPAAGLSSTVQMSNDTDARVVAASFSVTGSHTSSGSFQAIPSLTVRGDTHGMISGTTVTIPVSGWYDFSGNIGFASNATGIRDVQIAFSPLPSGVPFSPTTQFSSPQSALSGGQTHVGIGGAVYLNAGTQITFLAYQNSGGGLAYGDTLLTVKRLSGPSAIASSESVGCSYFQTAALTPGDSYVNRTLAKYTTKRFDTHGIYDTSTGIATIPVSGKYYVKAQLLLDRTSGSVADAVGVVIRKNSGDIFEHSARILTTTANNESPRASGLVDLNAGDTISVYCYVVGISGRANLANTLMNSFDIVRVGN